MGKLESNDQINMGNLVLMTQLTCVVVSPKVTENKIIYVNLSMPPVILRDLKPY